MSYHREVMFAPAAPFIAAAEEWVANYVQRLHFQAPAKGMRVPPRQHAIRVLAEEAGMNRDLLVAFMNGERDLIGLAQADKLSLALDIPLRSLAEDFYSLDELRRREAA
jgi:hypothetical protein